MARANFLWGAPRIHGELLKLGITASQATVSRYMPPSRKDRRSQAWRTFVRNHAITIHDGEILSCNDEGLWPLPAKSEMVPEVTTAQDPAQHLRGRARRSTV
jgi:hypothetical protein